MADLQQSAKRLPGVTRFIGADTCPEQQGETRCVVCLMWKWSRWLVEMACLIFLAIRGRAEKKSNVRSISSGNFLRNSNGVMPFRPMPDSRRLGLLVLLVLVSGSTSAAALANDSPALLYPQKEALRLARKPIARMVDDSICERIAGVAYQNRHLVAGANVALFRSNNRSEPFMRVVSREDGVTVARFPAIPGEVIYGRGYVIDPETGQERYGNAGRSICVPEGKVKVGELTKVASDSLDADVDEVQSGQKEQP